MDRSNLYRLDRSGVVDFEEHTTESLVHWVEAFRNPKQRVADQLGVPLKDVLTRREATKLLGLKYPLRAGRIRAYRAQGTSGKPALYFHRDHILAYMGWPKDDCGTIGT